MTDCEMQTLLRLFLKRKQSEFHIQFHIKYICDYTNFCITSKLIGARGLVAVLLVFNTHFRMEFSYYYQL